VVAIWFALWLLNVTELQAYLFPPSLALLGIGWNERRRDNHQAYRLLTIPALLLLTISAFVQSFGRGAYGYAVLLGLESVAVLGWGLYAHSRDYVTLGVAALIANGLVQFGPAFVELPRWVHLGLAGIILFGGGLAALFRREQILTARGKLTEEWKKWEP
jgi:hypothetical protein